MFAWGCFILYLFVVCSTLTGNVVYELQAVDAFCFRTTTDQPSILKGKEWNGGGVKYHIYPFFRSDNFLEENSKT